MPVTTLYPEIEPHASGLLRVDEVHEIYWEVSGNPDGKPVVFLHGGPGGGTEPKHRRFFDPKKYRIVLLDQRGCGKSRPHASLTDNTTWHIVQDIEALREHLEIERWQVFGGSWGSTLALAYAQKHPKRVTELVLRGIFTFAKDEMDWFYRDGTRMLFPDAYADFLAAIPPEEHDDIVGAYHKRLTGDDPKARAAAARAWSLWECRVATLMPDPDLVRHCDESSFTLAFARIECHYFVNNGFLESNTQLLDNIDVMRDIPGVIVHGRYDVICPPRNAWRLHQAWPESSLTLVDDAGHSANEPGILRALVKATDSFADRPF
ncbi:MAG: prolyl aminopeptidase [Nannocystales bacterium]